ncbi:MAG: polymer-forming cytoskeletal protein [Alphaproteobacteria bacterium]|nr:polymer-forming cytoskeletal protein [Alphaproteobacteria bacterium]
MTDDSSTTPQFRPDPPRRVVEIPGPSARRRSTPSDAPGKKLLVGREIKLSGEITACDTLVVEGTVEAQLKDSRVIEVARSGHFKGSADIDVAEIGGHFDGELIVRQRLLIESTGLVTGTIRYKELEIERGGRLSGDIQIISDDDEPSSGPSSNNG